LIRDEAAMVGNLILHAEEKDVEDALAIIRKKPILMYCQTNATDPLGRCVKGTLLQIAAMAGDVDLKAGILDEKDRGMVERLITTSNLSREEVAEQLQVITGQEAQLDNEARNQQILAAMKKFGTEICEIKVVNDIKLFQTLCKPQITQLGIDLKLATGRVITSGYIFDPIILQTTAKWFEENVDKLFGCWNSISSHVFWVNGFAKLQRQLSSRDSQVINFGIGSVVDQGILPVRKWKNDSEASYMYESVSRGWGVWKPGAPRCAGYSVAARVRLGKLMSSKICSIENLCNAQIIDRSLNLG
jgi:hypothetical protein